MKKTVSDLMALKERKCTPFPNAYIHLMLWLADSYSKSDGIGRIKAQLKDWDEEEFRKALISHEK